MSSERWGQVCEQIDAALFAENSRGGMLGCFGRMEEGISSGVRGGNGRSGVVSLRRPFLRHSGSFRNKGLGMEKRLKCILERANSRHKVWK